MADHLLTFRDDRAKPLFNFLVNISEKEHLDQNEYFPKCFFSLVEDINILVQFYQSLNGSTNKPQLSTLVKEVQSGENLVFSARTLESIKSRYKTYLSLIGVNELLNLIHFYKNILNYQEPTQGVIREHECNLFINKQTKTFEIQFKKPKSLLYVFTSLEEEYNTIVNSLTRLPLKRQLVITPSSSEQSSMRQSFHRQQLHIIPTHSTNTSQQILTSVTSEQPDQQDSLSHSNPKKHPKYCQDIFSDEQEEEGEEEDISNLTCNLSNPIDQEQSKEIQIAEEEIKPKTSKPIIFRKQILKSNKEDSIQQLNHKQINQTNKLTVVPSKYPEINQPRNYLEITQPTKSPEIKDPRVSPEKKDPEIIQSKISPGINQQRKSPEINQSRQSPGINQSRKSPEINQPRKSLEVNQSEKSKEINSRKSLEINEPRKSSEMNQVRKSTEINQARKSSKINLTRKSSEINETNKQHRQYWKESSPECLKKSSPKSSPEYPRTSTKTYLRESSSGSSSFRGSSPESLRGSSGDKLRSILNEEYIIDNDEDSFNILHLVLKKLTLEEVKAYFSQLAESTPSSLGYSYLMEQQQNSNNLLRNTISDINQIAIERESDDNNFDNIIRHIQTQYNLSLAQTIQFLDSCNWDIPLIHSFLMNNTLTHESFVWTEQEDKILFESNPLSPTSSKQFIQEHFPNKDPSSFSSRFQFLQHISLPASS